MPESLKRPTLIHVIVADSIHLSPEGKVTAYGIFNRINIAGLPAIHPTFSLLITIGYGKPDKYSMHFLILSPSNKKVLETPVNEFQLDTPRVVHNWCTQFQGFQLGEEGEYRIVIYLRDEGLPLTDQTLFFVEKKKG